MELIIIILGLIFVTIGVVSIFEARKLTKKLFSFQDINEGAKTLKFFGLVLTILGLAIVFIYFLPAMEYIK